MMLVASNILMGIHAFASVIEICVWYMPQTKTLCRAKKEIGKEKRGRSVCPGENEMDTISNAFPWSRRTERQKRPKMRCCVVCLSSEGISIISNKSRPYLPNNMSTPGERVPLLFQQQMRPHPPNSLSFKWDTTTIPWDHVL